MERNDFHELIERIEEFSGIDKLLWVDVEVSNEQLDNDTVQNEYWYEGGKCNREEKIEFIYNSD